MHVGSASAQASDRQALLFSGFATVGAVRSNERQADVTTAYYQPNGAGATRQWATTLDTVLGLQLTANVTDQLSAVVQVVTQQQWENAYTPMVEWANVRYAFTPDLSVRLGRIVSPIFLASDTRKIGYTQTSVRPPVEAYGIYEFSNSDGVDATYRFRLGKASDTLIAVYGSNDVMSPDGTDEGWRTTVDDYQGLINRLEYGPWTFQLAYAKGKVEQEKLVGDPDPIVASFARFPAVIRAAGLVYDPGEWIFSGEWVSLRARGIGERVGWYVQAGYRFGAWTPYVSYAERGPLKGGVDFGDTTAQNNTTLGVRWDFRKDMDLKVQYERLRMADPGSSGYFINLQPDYQPGGRASLISVVVDFVF